jgi:hypothetical protein
LYRKRRQQHGQEMPEKQFEGSIGSVAETELLSHAASRGMYRNARADPKSDGGRLVDLISHIGSTTANRNSGADPVSERENLVDPISQHAASATSSRHSRLDPSLGRRHNLVDPVSHEANNNMYRGSRMEPTSQRESLVDPVSHEATTYTKQNTRLDPANEGESSVDPPDEPSSNNWRARRIDQFDACSGAPGRSGSVFSLPQVFTFGKSQEVSDSVEDNGCTKPDPNQRESRGYSATRRLDPYDEDDELENSFCQPSDRSYQDMDAEESEYQSKRIRL